MAFINIIGGLLLLFLGGESLVRGAVKIAKKFNVSTLVIGVTVVAYGTSSPEFLITLQAILQGSHEIALGNVIGSNIANTFLVLGLASILFPIAVAEDLVKFDLRYMIIASFALLIFVLSGLIGRIEGAVLVAILFTYTISTLRRHQKNKNDALKDQVEEFEGHLNVKINFPLAVILVVAGIIMLAIGGGILVSGTSEVARYFGVSEAAIAVTIVAIGGSAPELATSIVAACRKHSDIAIANVIGSNIFNILGVLGVSSMIVPIRTVSTLAIFDIWVVVLSALLLHSLVRNKLQISRINGVLFVTLYCLYILWQFLS